MRVTVRVPATSANLGPGFDCFGLALDLCNEVTIDTEDEPGVTWEGEGESELPNDGSDRISRTMAAAAAAAGRALPPLAMRATNRIPLERGLGSSAAAAVAGVVLADQLLHLGLDAGGVLSSAVGVEGHPDNAAAAVLGGLTIAAGETVLRLAPHASLRPVLLIPSGVRLPTSRARDAMPREVPLPDAVFNLQRTALAVVALTERPAYLPLALDDRLHQPYRLPLVPDVHRVFDELREAGTPVCVSGAGPTLLAFETDGLPVPEPERGWQVLRPAVRLEGYEVETAAGQG
jgi:homoserine kinase